jgi:hypothetical protein
VMDMCLILNIIIYYTIRCQMLRVEYKTGKNL